MLICAVALGTAAPAAAGEDVHPVPAPAPELVLATADTMPLLLLDERTTWGTPASLVQIAPGFDITAPITLTAAPPMPDDLVSFDALESPAASFAYLPGAHVQSQTVAFAPATYVENPGIRLTGRTRAEPMGGATDALSVSSNNLPHYRPRRSALDTTLVLRIDGNADSPPLSFGGGVASVLNVLPRR